jgi:hypothetical protein
MSKGKGKRTLSSPEKALEHFLCLLGEKNYDKALYVPYKLARLDGDVRITREFVACYRHYMEQLIERYVDQIIQKTEQGATEYRAERMSQMCSSPNNQHLGVFTPVETNPNGVIVRRAK